MQLGLFDCRAQNQVVQLGWSQQVHSQMSQFIHPGWSSCGTMVSSGSTDPVVHIFDLRYNKVSRPSFSIPAHDLRVLKAAFHPEDNGLLVSISSDKKIGLHAFTLTS